MRILVTGGTGYIGSHTVVELLQAGFKDIVIVDNLSNSTTAALDNIKKITGTRPEFVEADIADAPAITALLTDKLVDAVMHFAAFKAVGESVSDPLKYYQNNVAGFVSLLQQAVANNVRCVVFSSTAAVYGDPAKSTITEDEPCNPVSPYGWSKRMDEIILADTCHAQPALSGVALRYFNVVGAHDSGLLGESPKGRPNNLLPIIVQAVAGTGPELTVFGTDYPTKDGTCERDYIHVVDLAKAHVAALNHALKAPGYHVYNVGTGTPTSVKNLIDTFERVNKVTVPHTFGERRPGDPMAYFAAPDKANRELNWHAQKTTEDAVRDAWRWQQAQ